MGIGTAFEKSLARTLLKQGAGNVDELAKVQKALATEKGFSQMEADALAAFQRSNGGVTPALNDVPAQLDEAALTARKAAVEDPKADPSLAQADSPEQYRVRLEKQFTPDYVHRTLKTMGDDRPVGPVGIPSSLDILQAREANDLVVAGIMKGLATNPRFASKHAAWQGDSPYKLQFHVDKFTDQREGVKRRIQFDDPAELGDHKGSVRASEGILGGDDGVTSAIIRQQSQSDFIRQIASEADIPEKVLERSLSRSLTRFFQAKFNKESKEGIWDDCEGIVDTIQRKTQMGPIAKKFIGELQESIQPNTSPVFFRGKNGLLLPDDGNFYPETVGKHLRDLFTDIRDLDEIEAALQAGTRPEVSKALQTFIEKKGYDHVVYFNRAEDKGSLSIINWNPDLELSPWDPLLHGGNTKGQAGAAASYILGALGLGAGASQVRADETFPKVGTRGQRPGAAIINPDGSESSERTISVGFDKGIMLIPTIIKDEDGFLVKVSNKDAITAHKAGKNPAVGGPFETEDEATEFAKSRSDKGGRFQ